MIRMSLCDTPVGALHIAMRDDALCAVGFSSHWPDLERRLVARFGALDARAEVNPDGVTSRLAAYLEGDVHALDAIRVDTGGTPFQRRVWEALRAIPAGAPISYGTLADLVGAPRASRAVGTANGANPVSVVIPCHRVIRGDGSLSGYAGGVARKRWLLAHEERHARGPGQARARAESSLSAWSQS